VTEWIVTSCVLIAVVLAIRFLLKNRISGRLLSLEYSRRSIASSVRI
jgi:hypothetical protein